MLLSAENYAQFRIVVLASRNFHRYYIQINSSRVYSAPVLMAPYKRVCLLGQCHLTRSGQVRAGNCLGLYLGLVNLS